MSKPSAAPFKRSLGPRRTMLVAASGAPSQTSPGASNTPFRVCPCNDRARAHEGRRERHRRAGRRAILGGSDIDDAALAHDGDAVGNGKRFLLIVRYQNGHDRKPLLQAADFLAQLGAQIGVEIGQRLIEQKDGWLDHKRARNRDALLLAAGKLRRIPRGELCKRHHF